MLLYLSPCSAAAQTSTPVFDASTLRQPANLDGIWLVHGGDDPAYAQAAFDDSHWTRFDPHTDLRNVFHRPYPQVVWYRMHVKVSPSQAGLGLREWDMARAYEIYVNGQLFMHAGRVAPFSAYTIGARVIKAIPDEQIATGSLVIALRVHIAPAEWTGGFPGLYFYNLSIGQESALRQQAWLAVIGENAGSWLTNALGLGLALVALALFYAQRDHKEYLWIALMFLTSIVLLPFNALRYFQERPAVWDLFMEPLILARILFGVLLFLAFLRLRINRWFAGFLIFTFAGFLISVPLQSQGSVSTFVTLLEEVPGLFLITVLIPLLLLVHWRRGNHEAGILLIPCLLDSLNIYVGVGISILQAFPATVSLGVRLSETVLQHSFGPFSISLNQLSGLAGELSFGLIIVLRATRISKQQALLEHEMSAAREVQQVILPDQVNTIPGFSIESVYLPAQQVGGDFFQVMPIPGGGLLLVLGDVAGKGLPAAMLVSVLVGATRAAAEYTTDPAELLANLNDRLVGRANGAYSTALAARIDGDGWVTIANAGHLPPYLGGREVELPGALPLGVQSGMRYANTRFHFDGGERLTFYSDGVVEAQNHEHELFGFERGREVSTLPAAEVAQAAQGFGQQDDITVVAIAREKIAVPIPA